MKVFIKTYGCQMNMRDSEAMAGMLNAKGYEIVNHENNADIILFSLQRNPDHLLLLK